MTSVSVVIPCFNAERFVGETVASVLAQTRPPDEVIVVDDGSTDGSRTVLAQFGDRVTVISQPNAGVAAARNAGLERASGDVVAFLDADDLWLPQKLERQVELFSTSPSIGLVHCGMARVDACGSVLDTELRGMEGHVARDLLLLRRPVILGGGSGFAARRLLLEEIGGFDETLSTSADWDLFYRLARRTAVGFVREILLHYRVHGANMTADVDLTRDDMLRALDKAFTGADEPTRRLRRRSLARLHVILSGSYLAMGRKVDAVGHGLRAATLDPTTLGRVLTTPVRRMRRR